MAKIIQYGFIKEGKLNILNRKRLQEDLRQLKDCDVIIEIRKRGKRSLPQNNYYHGIIVEEIRIRLVELGHRVDHDTVHEFLKQRFHSEKIVVPETGELLEIGKSTTLMNKGEFGIYIDSIIEWAAQTLDLAIPAANTQTEFSF